MTTSTQLKTAIVILAAGGSRRLGKPKQALPYRDSTLLLHCIKQALSLKLPTHVVLGGHSDQFSQQLAPLPVTLCINEQWSQGISTSIQCGLHNIDHSIHAVLFMLCDQPFIPTAHYQGLIQSAEDKPQSIIATQYQQGHTGVPAIIPKSLFPELMALQGDKGAQKIISRHQSKVISKHCLQASWDIDTPEQAQWLHSGPPQKDL